MKSSEFMAALPEAVQMYLAPELILRRARIGDHAQFHGSQRAVFAHAGFVAQDLRMPAARAGKLLAAGGLQPHRPARNEGQMRAKVFDQHLLLAAEAAAQPWLNYANSFDRQAD